MRRPHLATAFFALLVLTMLSSFAPAVSAPSSNPGSDPGFARAGETDEYTITSRVVKRRLPKGGKGLFFVGSVEPSQGPVYIQRATKCNKETNTCNFKFYKRKYLKNGRYEARIEAPPKLRGWMWRARVGNSYSDQWVTCTKTDRQVEQNKNCKIPF
ncbi:hypothetical protein [Nocardioides sp. GXZ039]|uniref:hypothetical protein n=1 Tax=Nocardioides sp. GXZ039 TaxID=3136018 RepID=UPI0030F43EE4